MDVLVTLISAVISAIVAYIVCILMNKNSNKQLLDSKLDNILNVSIQYPYLESRSFTNTWVENMNSTDEKYIRYDNYCALVYNYFQKVCEYCHYEETKIEEMINLKDWICIHKENWENPLTQFENIKSYPKELRDLLKKYLEG